MPKKKEVKKEVKKKPEAKKEKLFKKAYGIVTGSEQLEGGPIPRLARKVAIVGFAPTSMKDVSTFFGNPEFEIWGLNQLYMAFPAMAEHATRWFQIHSRQSYDVNIRRDHSHHKWMSEQRTFPIYMQEKQPDIPVSIAFPKELIMKEFGNYFTNSISWEIALAIYEGFEEIHIYGVDMAMDSEYQYERPSVEYFLGWAKGRGIKLVVPNSSDLLKSLWLYPFEDSAPFREKIQARRRELRERANMFGNQEQSAHDSRMQLMGALDNMNYIEKTWTNCGRELAVQNEKLKGK